MHQANEQLDFPIDVISDTELATRFGADERRFMLEPSPTADTDWWNPTTPRPRKALSRSEKNRRKRKNKAQSKARKATA